MPSEPLRKRPPSTSAEREYRTVKSEAIPKLTDDRVPHDTVGSDPPSPHNAATVEPETVAGSGIRDIPTTDDHLGFEPYVKAMAAFLTHPDTRPPLTLSIEGPWGSGKSSFMYQLEKRINEVTLSAATPPVTIRFNAWRLEKEEAVWAGYASSVVFALRRSVGWKRRLAGDVSIRISRFDWAKGWFDLARFVVLSLLLLFTSVGVFRYISSHPQVMSPFSADISNQKGDAKDTKPEEALLKLLISSIGGAGYLLLGFMVLKKASETLGNPFDVDLRKFSGNPGYDDQKPFIERFHYDFSRILKTYGKGLKLFIFIDDLDRCEIPRAAELMQAINLVFGDSDQIIHVIGIDREKIAAGIAAKYRDLLPFLQDASGGDGLSSATDFGYSFLEKFIQLPFQLPRATDREVQKFLDVLNAQKDDPESEPLESPQMTGILFETQADSPLVKSIVAKMAPALEYNPRRIKQFINQFRLSAIVGTATGLFNTSEPQGYDKGVDFKPLTPEALGKLLVVSLRWPRLLEHASKFPELFDYMEEKANGKNPSMLQVEDYDRVRELGDTWYSKNGVRLLVNAGLDDLEDRYSLADVDIERFIQIAPAVSRPNRIRPEAAVNHIEDKGAPEASAPSA